MKISFSKHFIKSSGKSATNSIGLFAVKTPQVSLL